MNMRRAGLRTCDLFCGAGGWTEGLRRSRRKLGIDAEVHFCLNHWPVAVDSHARNHPYASHVCDSLNEMDPRHVGKLHGLIASPECTHFSVARGAAPINDQRRIPAGSVAYWIENTHPEFFAIENVKEFQDWGPLYPDDHPVKKLRGKRIPERKGESFMEFVVEPIKSLGYSVEWKVLNCADYGDPTTRRRLFILGRRDGRPVEWPEPTHAKDGAGGLKPWVPASSIIDWSIPACSIFATQEEAYAWAEFHGIPKRNAPRRPLAANTMARIAHGIEKYWGDAARPFLSILRGQSKTRDIDSPLATLTCGEHQALAVPYMIPQQQGWDGKNVRSLEDPMQTIATKGAEALAIPFFTEYHGGDTGDERHGGLQKTLPTVDCANRFGIVRPFFTKLYGTGKTEELNLPISTLTGGGNKHGTCIPFLQEYYSNGGNAAPGHSVNRPLPTITCTDRFGVVQRYGMDILYRMLDPRELAAAMSFPPTYQWSGTKADVVRQIGNAVPVLMAEALLTSLIKQTSVIELAS